jgi:hypothetical protein
VPALIVPLPVVPQRPEQRPLHVGAVAGGVETGLSRGETGRHTPSPLTVVGRTIRSGSLLLCLRLEHQHFPPFR